MWPALVPTVGLFAFLGAGLCRLLWPEQSSSGHSEPPRGPAWYPHWSDPTPGTSAAKKSFWVLPITRGDQGRSKQTRRPLGLQERWPRGRSVPRRPWGCSPLVLAFSAGNVLPALGPNPGEGLLFLSSPSQSPLFRQRQVCTFLFRLDLT